MSDVKFTFEEHTGTESSEQPTFDAELESKQDSSKDENPPVTVSEDATNNADIELEIEVKCLIPGEATSAKSGGSINTFSVEAAEVSTEQNTAPNTNYNADFYATNATTPNEDATGIETRELKVRLDKWLWAARFYKTRALARAAVEAGRVLYNAQPTNPSLEIEIGCIVTIIFGKRNQKRYVIRGLSTRRRNANEANELYTEIKEQVYHQNQGQYGYQQQPYNHNPYRKKFHKNDGQYNSGSRNNYHDDDPYSSNSGNTHSGSKKYHNSSDNYHSGNNGYQRNSRNNKDSNFQSPYGKSYNSGNSIGYDNNSYGGNSSQGGGYGRYDSSDSGNSYDSDSYNQQKRRGTRFLRGKKGQENTLNGSENYNTGYSGYANDNGYSNNNFNSYNKGNSNNRNYNSDSSSNYSSNSSYNSTGNSYYHKTHNNYPQQQQRKPYNKQSSCNNNDKSYSEASTPFEDYYVKSYEETD